MVKECMDPVTCMLPVMLSILLEPACPVFVLRFLLLFSLVGALSPLGQGTCYTSLPRVLRCRLASTLAVIASSAVLSSFLLSVSHKVNTIEVKC